MEKIFVLFLLVSGLLIGCDSDDKGEVLPPEEVHPPEVEIIPSENFSDKSFYDYLIANFDADSDGFINTAEAVAVKVIDVSKEREIVGIDGEIVVNEDKMAFIQSLKGIGYFTSLEKLVVQQQTQMELPDLSENLELKELIWIDSGTGSETVDLSRNTKLTSLHYASIKEEGELDISHNTALERLRTHGGIHVASFSKNTSLKHIQISGWPPETVFDFSSNTLLESLYLRYYDGVTWSSENYEIFGLYNIETVLNIGNHTNLKYLHVEGCATIRRINLQQADKLEEVYIDNRDSLFLDLSGSTELKIVKLQFIEEADINISNCISLSDFTIAGTVNTLNASGCTSLRGFYWGNILKLKNADFSNCTSLSNISFDVHRNIEIETLNVDNCTALSYIECPGIMKKLDLSTCSGLSTLICYAHALNELNLTGCPNLTYLDCSSSSTLTVLDVTGCTKLRTLHCGYTYSLKELDLSTCTALTYLYLPDCGLITLDVYNCRELRLLRCNYSPFLKTITLYKYHHIGNLDYYIGHTQIILKE